MKVDETGMTALDIPSQRANLRNRLLVLGAISFVLAALVLPLDLPIARVARSGELPGDLRTLFRLSEAFSHGYGALLILIGVAVINRLPGRDIIFLAACTYLPGLVTSGIKISIARQRPGSFAGGLPDSVFDTFSGLGGVWTGDAALAFDRAVQSFPSGHTATAVGLAVGLSLRFPRGAWYFSLLAILAAWQRIDSQAHFPSDTLAAAGIALWCGALLSCWWPGVSHVGSPPADPRRIDGATEETAELPAADQPSFEQETRDLRHSA